MIGPFCHIILFHLCSIYVPFEEPAQIFSAFAVHRGARSMLDVSAMRLLLASAMAWDYVSHLAATAGSPRPVY